MVFSVDAEDHVEGRAYPGYRRLDSTFNSLASDPSESGKRPASPVCRS